MQSKELMIGDLIYNRKNIICKIIGIYDNKAVVNHPIYGDLHYKEEDVYPIPITKEFLEEHSFNTDSLGGYTFDTGAYFIHFKARPQDEEFKQDWIVVVTRGSSNAIQYNVRYIHEIQQLYRIIAKQELDIKL